MAQLTSEQKDALWAELMRHLSSEWIECSLSKSQLRTAVDVFDGALEDCESAILNSVGPQAKAWLLNNVTTARWIMDNVAQERTEVLGG